MLMHDVMMRGLSSVDMVHRRWWRPRFGRPVIVRERADYTVVEIPKAPRSVRSASRPNFRKTAGILADLADKPPFAGKNAVEIQHAMTDLWRQNTEGE